jgi:phosphoribosylformimino-5-aminoimidazole carboxamide ribotide isomerase
VLIPSIDLMGGRIVQLVQGERLALETSDIQGWIGRLAGFAIVQLIDLDAAIGSGDNRALVARICERLPCRVGGGLRTVDAARGALEIGAVSIIAGSALFGPEGSDLSFARALADAVGTNRVIAAVDSRAGRVVVKGWRERLPIGPVEAIARLEPFCGEFLYTHVDTEGLLGGIDMEAVLAVRGATRRGLSVAGGIRSRAEVDELERLGIDAVVGMALYTGALDGRPPTAGCGQMS